ncbi:MAG: MFS transporter [Candidatus Limnocylindria bacterium]
MEQSIWSPLGTPLFRAVWLAALASNVGGWMHLVAAQWEMTSLSDSAALVGLISTASALPAFLLALPAGALADVVDRRRLIVFAQAWQLVVAALLGVLTVADVTTPAVLLGATVVLGFGASLGLPAFSAVTTELVDRERLPAAISLNSVAMTLSQALGPAIGGLLVASIGSGGVFLLNAVSFVGVVAVLVAWHRTPPVSGLPPEHVSSAMRAGVRYLANAPELRGVLLRVGAYVLGYSAVPALLAVLVRTRLDGDASAFGLLLGCVGIGGVLGATLLPRLRGRLGPDRVAASCTLAVAAAVAALATVPSLPAAYPVMVVLGFVSIGVISSLMIAAQAVLPDWVRGRGLAMLGLVFQAGFAAGAACWGVLAAETSVTVALGVAAAFVAVGSLLGLRFRLADAEGLDVRPAHALEPYPPVSLAADDGPVQLSVEYDVPAEDLPAFQLTAGELGRARRRAGAMHWTLYADIRDRQRQVESFTVASWGEHERQSERVTEADRAVFDRVRAFHRGEESPRERALISERPGHRHGGHDAG